MTVETLICEDSYVASGVATLRTIGFPIFDPAHLSVLADGVEQTLGSDYSVSGDYRQGLGQIVPLVTWPAGTRIFYHRITPKVQRASVPPGQPLPAQSIEGQLDRTMLAVQETEAGLTRALQVPFGETGGQLPPRLTRANKIFIYDENGDFSVGGGVVRLVGYDQTALRRALDADGTLQVVLDNLPADGTDPVRILWDTAARMKRGDALYAFIMASAGYNSAQMDALLANATEPDLDYAASLDPSSIVAIMGELLASDGSDRIGTKRASLLTAAQYRTLAAKLNDRFDLRDMAGLDLTGNNDMASLMQAAVDHAISNKVPLHGPIGKITLGSTVTINDSFTMLGEGCGTGKASSGASGLPVTSATQFHLAHNGKGFAIDGQGEPFDWVLFRDIMTSRIQPAPTNVINSFVPGDQDYDFDVYGASGLQLQNVCTLNPARQINMRGGGGIGRLWTDNLSGQPLRVGVNVELCADVMRLHNTHYWPFWRDHVEVARWTLRNCDHLNLKRCDTPLVSNFFSIAARSAIRIGSNEYGGMGKGKFSNIDVDYGGKNIWFDETAENCWAFFSNVSLQGAIPTELANTPGLAQRVNVLMEGSGANFLFMNGAEMSAASGSAVSLETPNQRCEVGGGFWLQEYGGASQEGHTSTDSGIFVVTGSTFVTTCPILNTLPGLGTLAGGGGRIVGVLLEYAPGVVPQSGVYTDASLTDAQFIDDGHNVSGTVNVLVANAGAATGYMDVTLPTELDISYGFTAFDITDGTMLAAIALPGDPAVARVTRGGGNVGISGHTINLTFNYARKAD